MRADGVTLPDFLDLIVADAPVRLADVTVTMLWASEDPDVLGEAEIRLGGDVDFFSWIRLVGEGAFHLGTAELDADPVGGFDATYPVRIELQLEPDAVSRWLPQTADADPAEVAAALVRAAPDHALRRGESYRVVAATQEIRPGVRAGFTARFPFD